MDKSTLKNGQSAGASTPIFMVGIDGADSELVQSLLAAGRLPTLAKLVEANGFMPLSSPADEYAGGVWPDFYTGQSVPWHGIYHNKLWRQESMRCEVPTDEWLASRPFYETLSEQGFRVCVIDMPMVLGSPRPLNGVYLGGWGTHDLISKGSSPPELWRQMAAKYGEPHMPVEHFGRQDSKTLLLLRDQLLSATEQITEIGLDLLSSERWDFSCIVLGAAHRGGHYLWDSSQISKQSASEQAELNEALTQVYQACDSALEKLLKVAPAESLQLVFAVHGMQPNHGWGDLGPDLLESIVQHSRGTKPKRGLLYTLRRKLPFHLVGPVLRRMPQAVTDKLVELWSSNMYDWETTPYFPVPMDQAGYIRINLRGREQSGIVAPGNDYRQLCDELEELLLSLRDADSGEAIVARVIRAWQQAPEDAPARDTLPDLVVIWSELSSRDCRHVVSSQLPDLTLDVPERNFSGRSGNHIGRGWWTVSGAALRSVSEASGSIRDFAPSIFATLGARPPEQFDGATLLWNAEAHNDH